MTTSNDPQVAAAIERGDADWLAVHVDGTACPAAVVSRLARHPDPRLRLLAVQWTGARLPRGSVDDDLLRVPADETPEVALALAELFQRHGRRLPPAAWPRWREAAPAAVVRVAWLRAEFLHLPGRLTAAPVTEAGYQAVAGLRCADATDPPRLLDELTGRDDPVLHAAAFRLCREGLHAAVLAPAIARRVLVRLLDGTDPSVVAAALTELAEPWAAVDPVPPARLRAFLTVDPATPTHAGALASAQPVTAGGPAVVGPAGPGALRPVQPVTAGDSAGLGALLSVQPVTVGDPAVVGPARAGALRPVQPVTAGDTAGPGALLSVQPVTVGDPAVGGPARGGAVVAGTAADAGVVVAAVAAAARHGLRDPLLDAAADRRLPPEARRRALAALGDLLDRDHIPAVVDLGGTDPLLLGRPAIDCLTTMHHRGLIPAAGAAPGIVGLALADHTIPAGDAATLLYTARHAARDALLAADGPEPGWPRRLELLVALGGQGAPDLDVGADIAGRLAEEPEPFLAALRALRHAPAEDAVLAVLHRAPAAALRTLEAVGGARTVAELTSVVLERDDLLPWRHQILELCWLLETDPGRRHELLRWLDPVALPARIAADLGRPDERELAVLRARTTPDRPLKALLLLTGAANAADAADAASGADATKAADGAGGAADVPAVTEVFGRIVAELALAHDTRGNPPGQQHPLPADLAAAVDRDQPAPSAVRAMPVVPREALDALRGLGRRLHRRAQIRPVCLLDAGSQEAAGDAFAAGVALELLDRPSATPTELAVLLEVLQRAPYEGTRRRVHRLLRHRDPHVRKHAIAALARDGAEALAPTLTLLTAATDVQTVRQALAALGQVGARWAGHAVVACLDHPNMNIKKAAAEALRTTGTPATVPGILGRLGRDDNPGLRAALTAALRAILGAAWAATVLAAFEHGGPGRLLESLDGALSARAVAALTDQGSPAGPALLRLAAEGRLRLLDGTIASLAGRMAEHGITPPVRPAPSEPHPDLVALTRDGWHAGTARRVVALDGDLPEALLPGLRRLLPDWLRLAAADPALRPSVLRLIVRCCPAPWTAAELAVVARARSTVVTGAGELSHADRDALLDLLADLAPDLTPAAALDLASGLRAVPPAPAGVRTTLGVLRRCGAVLTRRDVDRALADAALGADPWRGEIRVLHEAFGVAPSTLDTPGSRKRLVALIEAWPSTTPADRPALLDRMAELQPIDAPQWTIGEAARSPGPPVRTPHDGDLDQPRSAALRDRLLAMIEHPQPGTTQRRRAAEVLRSWPEPAIQRRLLQVYLRGDTDLSPATAPARALTAGDLAPTTPVPWLRRAVELASRLGAAELPPLVPALLDLCDHADPEIRTAAVAALRRLPGPTAAALLGEPVAPVLLPAPAEPHLPPALLERPAPPAAVRPPTRQDLLERARSGDATQIRVALAALAESGSGGDLADLLGELLGHPDPKVRLHAHRVSRQLLERPAYLRHSEILLADPQPDIVRAAVRAVAGGAWSPAVGAVVGLLLHPDPTVRRTAEAGLARFGAAAVPALTKAAARARPDRRAAYTTVLATITAADLLAGGQ